MTKNMYMIGLTVKSLRSQLMVEKEITYRNEVDDKNEVDHLSSNTLAVSQFRSIIHILFYF